MKSIVKSPCDKREYDIVHLRNGLSALLIHDPDIKDSTAFGKRGHPLHDSSNSEDEKDDVEYGEEEGTPDDLRDAESTAELEARPNKKAAVAMCVSVGSFSDPQDAPGLAHLLEHMLLLGSTKFPDEDEYSRFLAKHGGSSNTFTKNEHTCYDFDVNPLYLREALDRFSQHFVSPVIKESLVAREVEAVDSEFCESSQRNFCRWDQIRCSTADPNHPYNRFAYGNAKSLTDPLGDIRQKVIEFYKRHYHASRMKLVVLGGEPLDTLKQWVSDLFENVPDSVTRPSNFTWNGAVWPSGKIYRIESVKYHRLYLSWELPCLNDKYLTKPDMYMSRVFEHESHGSLSRYFKLKGWATELLAGVDDSCKTSVGYTFTITITLTSSGLEKVFDIISSVFEYIKMLRENKAQKWVFEELQAIDATSFKFMEEEASSDYVVKLAENMLYYPEHHVIYGDYAFEHWDPKLIDDTLECLTPAGIRIDVLTKSFDKNAAGVVYEPWFGTPYTVDDVPEHLLLSWTSNTPGVNAEFRLPGANEFITRDVSIRPAALSGSSSLPWPTLVEDVPLCKVWYKLDQTFNTPRANVYLHITCKVDGQRDSVLCKLYSLLLEDALSEPLYKATIADLSCSLSSTNSGLQLKLCGYIEKLCVLARQISGVLKTLVVHKDRFQVIKEELERTLAYDPEKQYLSTASIRCQVLEKEDATVEQQQLLCLSDLSVEDIIPSFFSQIYIEALCHGNLTKDEALDIVKTFKDVLEVDSVHKEPTPAVKPKLELPPKTDQTYNTMAVKVDDENSVVEKFFEIVPNLGAETVRENALACLFAKVVDQPFSHQLRTVEQIGHTVFCDCMPYGVICFYFMIISPKYSPVYMHKRIDVFIDKLEQDLNNMSEEDFEDFKDSLLLSKMEKDSCLVDETERHWKKIYDESYFFDADEREAKVLKDIQKKDLVDWYKSYIKPGGAMRRSLCTQVWGCKLKEEMEKNKLLEEKMKSEKNRFTIARALKKLKDLFSAFVMQI